MNDTLTLERDRDLARLLDDTVALYRRHLVAAIALAAAVVIPVELIFSGVGLGQLTSGYDKNGANEVAAFSSLVSVLVTTPLVTGMLVRLAMAGDGSQGSARRAAAEGLERFGPLLAAVLLATLGIMLGLIAFIIPGVVLAVRWVVVAPAVVVEDRRGADALRRSAALVSGHAWWVLGVMFVQGIIVGVFGAILGIPADALARSADAAVFSLAGTIVAQILALPFSAFATTLLFFTLRARKGGVPGVADAAGPAEAGSVAAPGASPGAAVPGEPAPSAADWRPPAAAPPDDAGASPGGWEPPVPPTR